VVLFCINSVRTDVSVKVAVSIVILLCTIYLRNFRARFIYFVLRTIKGGTKNEQT
jgi:hypothetical protein